MRSKLPKARIVLDENGETPRRQNMLYAFKRFLKMSGLKERSFHSLRHFFISGLVRRGAGLEAVRMLAGHTKLSPPPGLRSRDGRRPEVGERQAREVGAGQLLGNGSSVTLVRAVFLGPGHQLVEEAGFENARPCTIASYIGIGGRSGSSPETSKCVF